MIKRLKVERPGEGKMEIVNNAEINSIEDFLFAIANLYSWYLTCLICRRDEMKDFSFISALNYHMKRMS